MMIPTSGQPQGVAVVKATPVQVKAEAVPAGDNKYGPGADGINYGTGLIVQLDTTDLRHSFIRKVYSILTVQLVVTFGFVALFTFSDGAINFIQENPIVFYGALIVSFACIIALSCFTSIARTHPYGIIFLMVFTLAESVLVGVLAANFDVNEVLLAVGATLLIVFGLTLFACQTKYDFTGWGPYLLVVLLVLIFFMFILIFIDESRTTRLIFAVIAVILFSAFLVYDTQLIMGGQHRKFEFDVDDYIFAALNLYLDIINLFIYLLLIIGGGGDR